QGAHPVPLTVRPFAAPPPSVAHDYQKATWQQLSDNPHAIGGKHVEIVGVLGRESSSFGFKGITEAEYRGFEFHDVRERPVQGPLIYFQKGTKAERMLNDVRQWDGRGTPPEKHVIRGVV